jgi:hypothetical protein
VSSNCAEWRCDTAGAAIIPPTESAVMLSFKSRVSRHSRFWNKLFRRMGLVLPWALVNRSSCDEQSEAARWVKSVLSRWLSPPFHFVASMSPLTNMIFKKRLSVA